MRHPTRVPGQPPVDKNLAGVGRAAIQSTQEGGYFFVIYDNDDIVFESELEGDHIPGILDIFANHREAQFTLAGMSEVDSTFKITYNPIEDEDDSTELVGEFVCHYNDSEGLLARYTLPGVKSLNVYKMLSDSLALKGEGEVFLEMGE